MLLNRFCDDQGWLWVGSQRADDVYKQRPWKAFVWKDIYTKHPHRDNKTPSFQYEHILGGIEDNAAPVINKVVTSARRLDCPKLSPREEADFHRFVLALARRTPESQTRVAQGLTRDDYFDICRDHAAQAGFPWSLDRDAFHADSNMTAFIERLRHNVDATFAAGYDPHLAAEEKKFAAETGFRFVVIDGSKGSFVLGSHGVTICDPGSVGPYLAGTVLPLAHDVLAHVTSRLIPTGLLILGDDRASTGLVNAVNTATAAQSETIGGRSEDQVRSLLQRQKLIVA